MAENSTKEEEKIPESGGDKTAESKPPLVPKTDDTLSTVKEEIKDTSSQASKDTNNEPKPDN